eukprot:360121-Chlamydomonas_euryale.AAC.18
MVRDWLTDVAASPAELHLHDQCLPSKHVLPPTCPAGNHVRPGSASHPAQSSAARASTASRPRAPSPRPAVTAAAARVGRCACHPRLSCCRAGFGARGRPSPSELGQANARQAPAAAGRKAGAPVSTPILIGVLRRQLRGAGPYTTVFAVVGPAQRRRGEASDGAAAHAPGTQ